MSYGPVTLWAFEEAPEEYRKLSPHGGDEDWIIFVPQTWAPILSISEDHLPDCLPFDRGRFGCCSVSRRDVTGGFVFIGAHA